MTFFGLTALGPSDPFTCNLISAIGYTAAPKRIAQTHLQTTPTPHSLAHSATNFQDDEFEAAWRKAAGERKSPAGRKPWDAVVMFKTIVLCALYNLSDDQVEYQLRDRLSFMRFLGLGLEDRVPDAKTVCEPLRVCRRLRTLRRWSHDEDLSKIFTGSARACRADGAGSPGGSSVAVGGDLIDCGEVWMLCGDAAQMGAAGRA